MTTVLKVQNLNKSFGKKQIIKNLSLEIHAGEVYGFLGPNGAGKTTVMKMIMGFLYPDQGQIEICGCDLQKEYEQSMSHIGGIIENPEMYKEFTAWQNLKLYSRVHGGITDERLHEVVKLLRLENRVNDKVKKFSLGMKQRLGLAQALVHNPDLLILDEPTNGLDPAGIHELRTTLKQLAHEQNKAVMVSSHLLSEIQMLCDRVAIIQEGQLIGVEPIDQAIAKNSEYSIEAEPLERAQTLLKEYFPDVRVEGDKIQLPVQKSEISRVLKFLLDNGVQVTGVTQENHSLESVFLKVTGGGKGIA